MVSKIIELAEKLIKEEPRETYLPKRRIYRERIKKPNRPKYYRPQEYPLGKTDPKNFSVITSGPFEGETIDIIPNGDLIIPFRYEGKAKIHQAIHRRYYNERRGIFYYRFERIEK